MNNRERIAERLRQLREKREAEKASGQGVAPTSPVAPPEMSAKPASQEITFGGSAPSVSPTVAEEASTVIEFGSSRKEARRTQALPETKLEAAPPRETTHRREMPAILRALDTPATTPAEPTSTTPRPKPAPLGPVKSQGEGKATRHYSQGELPPPPWEQLKSDKDTKKTRASQAPGGASSGSMKSLTIVVVALAVLCAAGYFAFLEWGDPLEEGSSENSADKSSSPAESDPEAAKTTPSPKSDPEGKKLVPSDLRAQASGIFTADSAARQAYEPNTTLPARSNPAAKALADSIIALPSSHDAEGIELRLLAAKLLLLDGRSDLSKHIARSSGASTTQLSEYETFASAEAEAYKVLGRARLKVIKARLRSEILSRPRRSALLIEALRLKPYMAFSRFSWLISLSIEMKSAWGGPNAIYQAKDADAKPGKGWAWTPALRQYAAFCIEGCVVEGERESIFKFQQAVRDDDLFRQADLALGGAILAKEESAFRAMSTSAHLSLASRRLAKARLKNDATTSLPEAQSAHAALKAALYANDFAKAKGLCDALLAKDPQDAEALALRGRCFAELDQPVVALRDLNKAIDLKETSPWVYFERAKIYASHLDHVNALKDFKIANLDGAKLTWAIEQAWSHIALAQSQEAIEVIDPFFAKLDRESNEAGEIAAIQAFVSLANDQETSARTQAILAATSTPKNVRVILASAQVFARIAKRMSERGGQEHLIPSTQSQVFTYLEQLVDLNFNDLALLEEEAAFDPLKHDRRWISLVAALRANTGG